MKHWIRATLIAVFVGINVFHGSAIELSAGGANVCAKQVQKTREYYVQVIYEATEYYSTCCGFTWPVCWDSCQKSRTVRRTRREVRTRYEYITVQECCAGYSQVGNQCPIPLCANGCLFGSCVAPDTCSCDAGYTGSTCATNIDECLTNNGGCQQSCVDTHGSYICGCYRGYTRHQTDKTQCHDVNECDVDSDLCKCADKGNNPLCTATCVNKVGSYMCSCTQGYESKDNQYCRNTIECNANNGNCSDFCYDTFGSYYCGCPNGYQLGVDKRTCKDKNECLSSNGDCDHVCDNTLGSRQCSCRPGYLLDANGKTCSDRDECKTTNHGCEYCGNLRGSYECTCPHGYVLNSDNKTCSDINECEPNSPGETVTLSGCDQDCVNTNGSFYCRCNKGYSLAVDNKTCINIDECALQIDECEQVCIDVLSTYVCACKVGYTLNVDDRKSCVGNPCEDLPQFANGKASCLKGVTGTMCSFQCNPGFEKAGSSRRWCQPNHKWNGTNAICKRKSCPIWQPPVNGASILPCNHFFESKCKIKCIEGYHLNGSDTRTCNAEADNDMQWTDTDATCEKSTICSPNPCFHSGICTPEDDKATCDCTKTGYKGVLCRTGIVTVPQLPILSLNIRTTGLQLSAKPDKELYIQLISISGNLTISPTNLTLTNSTTTASFSLIADAVGFFTIKFKLTGKNALEFVTPSPATVYVGGGDAGVIVSSPIDADGSIKAGCYMQNNIEGQTGVSNLKWDNDGSSKGIVQLSDNNGKLLPLSLSGGELKPDSFTPFPINNAVKAVGTDAPKSDKNCYSENDASKYIGELLDSNAFAYSIQNAFNNHSPYWIKFVAALHVQEYKSSDLGGGLFKGSELVNKRTPCTTGLPLNPHTVYYHYQTKQVFYAMFTNKNVTLPMTVTKCFVKDLTVDSVFVSIIPDTTNESSMDLFSNAFSKISNFNGMIDRVGFNLNTSSGDVMYSFGNRIMNLGNGEVDANISANGIMTWISKDISNIFTTSEMKSYTVRDGTVDFTLKWNVFNSTQSMQVKGDITQMRLMNENSSISPCNNGTINIQVSTKHTTFLTARIDNVFTFSKRHGIDALINHDVIGGDRSISSSDWQKITQKLRDDYVLQDTLSFLKGFSSINVEITISVNELIPIVEALINNAKSLSRTTTLLTMKDKAERITEIKTSLIDSTKRFQILLKRYLKIDFFDDADMERRHNTFKTYADDLIKQLEYEIDNSMTSRINWFKVSGVGDICVKTYCFKDLNVSLIYGSILANSKCYTGQQHNSNAKNTLLKGIVVNGTNVGGLIKLLPKTVVETNLLSSSNTITASFKGQLTVYNQSKLSDVNITNSSMSLNFDVAFMRQDRVQMNVTTSLASVALDDPVYFKFKSRFDSPSSLASDINKRVISILNDIEKNIDNRVSLILSYQNRTTRIALERVIEYMNMTNRLTNLSAQLASLMTNISYAEQDYEAKKKALNSSFATHALTTEQLQMKSKLLNDCRPKLCLPQCLPGITINVCQSEKTVFKMVRNCSFVLKSRNVLDVVQVNTTKSYIALDPKKICNTECPPLTGFFKKIFGKRKKRGLVNVVAVPALTSLFKKVGGTEGEIGAIVGGAVLGPLGAVVGGIIGSMFGSCDEVCRYVFLPKTVNYQVISIDRKLRTVEDLESVCKNSPTNTSIGFKEAEACPRFDNCSNLSVDKQCLKRNIECKLIKGNLSSILSNPSYDASYNEYITASALLDLLSTKQSILTKRVQNMQKEVEISKAASILANQSMELANMAKQEFYDLTVRERKLISKYKSIRDNDTVLDVEDVTFDFVHVDTMKFPKRFVLNIKYKNLVSSATQFSTMFNAPEYFSSVEDAARKLIDVVVESISGSSRKRRALTLPAMTQLEQKCISLENAALELYDIANSLDLEIKKYEKAHEDYTREVRNDETEARTYLERLTTSVANAYDCNEIHCDDGVKQVVGDISRELSNEKTETAMLTWNETLQRFFTNFELKIKARENSECISFLDCVTYHLDQLHKLVQYSDMKLAKKVKQHIPIWNSTILTLFNDNPSLEVAKKLTLEFLMSFHEVNPKDIFCGEAPKLETRLSGERHEMENTFLSLSIEIGETIHAYEIIWKRNNFVINSQYGKTMKVLMTDTKPAYYSCEVSNMFGKTHCGEVLVKVYAEPEIVNHPEDTTIHEYSPINKFIYCNVTGSQDLSIRWYYRSFMGNQSELLQNTGNALQIGVNSVAKSGYYHCLVQNRLYSIQSKIAVVNILPITMAVERTKLAFTLNLNKKSARNKRSVSANASVEMPSKINNDEMLNISVVVANAMNTTVSNIRELIYTKTAGDSVEVTFTLYGTNFTGELNKLSPTSSWDALSEQLMKDRENLILRSILLYYHANETMSFMIGGYNATVDPDSITSEGMEVSCQQGQIVLQNGFVCGDCPAGTRFDGVGKCIDCTKDMYQYLSGQLVCHQCPQHTETTSAKSVSIFDCKDITSTTATTKSTSTLTQRITPIEVDDEEDDKLKIIIPILTVVVILFIAGIIFCCVRNRQKKSADIKDPDATERHTNPTFEIGRFSSIESENAIENPYATCSDTGAVQMSNVNDYGVPSKIKQEKTNKRLSAIPNPYEFDDGEEVTKGAHTFENPTYRQNTLRSNSVDYDNLDRVRNVNNKQTRNTGHYEHAFVPIKKKTGESVSNEAFHDSD